MKTAKVSAGFFVALIVCHNSAVAGTSLEFPEQKIGLPATTLAGAVRESPRSFFKSPLPSVDFGRTVSIPVEMTDSYIFMSPRTDIGRTTIVPAAKPRDDKFVFRPDEGVDYKLTVKTPDPSVDYRLTVKNPDDAQKK